MAIFCLPDTDPDWFQGYLFITTTATSFGLLCENQEIDACLQCSEGGYREIQIQIINFREQQHRSNHKKKTITTLRNVRWTGGDMMCLQSDNNNDISTGTTTTTTTPMISMQADTIRTGSEAVDVVERVFASLLGNLRKLAADGDEPEEDNQHSHRSVPTVLELMVRTGLFSLWMVDRSMHLSDRCYILLRNVAKCGSCIGAHATILTKRCIKNICKQES
jgi:hypothetical protein